MKKIAIAALLLGITAPALADDYTLRTADASTTVAAHHNTTIPEKMVPLPQNGQTAEMPGAILTGATAAQPGVQENLTISLTDASGQPLTEDRLQTIHTRKVHLLVVDESLTDYQHIHPVSGNKPGSYDLSFTPKTGHGYRILADIAPKGEAEAYVRTQGLKGTEACVNPCVDRTVSAEKLQDGYSFRLSFDQPLKAGSPDMGRLDITDSSGKAVASLQPVLGTYAHIVAFYAAGDSMIHIHPMNMEPKSEADRGQSPILFHIEPEHAGFIKMFAQVNLDGKEMIVPFGQTVESGKEDPQNLIAHQ